MPTISYAQNREDIILEAYFADIKNGFYVDVGANDPVIDSVTKLFYDKGWSGINIEPNPELISKLKSHRPKDLNLQVAVSDKSGTASFRQYDADGLSTVSSAIKEQYIENPRNHETDNFKEYDVKIATLDEIFKANSVKHIHFLKIDVEGNEYLALKGNNWDRYRPEMICIEANHILKDWHSLLNRANYTKVFDDGLNEYFIANEHEARVKNFSYADQILGGEPALHRYWFTVMTSLNNRILATDAKLHSSRSAYSKLEADLEETQALVKGNADSPRYLLKQFFSATNKKIHNYIISKKKYNKSPEQPLIDEPDGLLKYDIEALYIQKKDTIFSQGIVYIFLFTIYKLINIVLRFFKRAIRFIVRKVRSII